MRKIHWSFIEAKHVFLITNHNEVYCENYTKILIVHSTVLTQKIFTQTMVKFIHPKKYKNILWKSSHANAKMPVLLLKIKKSALQACVRVICRCWREGMGGGRPCKNRLNHIKLKAVDTYLLLQRNNFQIKAKLGL